MSAARAGLGHRQVLVIGGGPAGLAAATELRRRGLGRVIVLEREREAGGIPRHSDHLGYGIRDLRRLLTGSGYARRLVARALAAGVELRTSTMATDWGPEGPAGLALWTSGPRGRERVSADAIVLATGCRERPRAARLVAGDRPAGVWTTGSLQQAVHLGGRGIGQRAVVVGAEHVSFSALLTLAHAGVRTVAMTTEHERHGSYGLLVAATAGRMGVPILTRVTARRVVGRGRVEAIELLEHATGRTREIACDTVVFTADWIPDHELARAGGIALDPGTCGPRADAAFRTDAPGVFAAGNLLHGAETADVATGEGRRAAESVVRWLAGEPQRPGPLSWLEIEVEAPFAWVSPNAVDRSLPAPKELTLRVSRVVASPAVRIEQAGRVLWSGEARSGLLPALPFGPERGPLVPGRAIHLPGAPLLRALPGGGPIVIRAG